MCGRDELVTPSSAAWSSAVRGAVIGIVAGVPQVLLTQLAARLLGVADSRADIGPRFVARLTDKFGASLPQAEHWVVAGTFHFAYAAGWGGLYALLQRWRPAQPHVGAPLLAAFIYTLAFSPWGAATQSGTESAVETRPFRETLLHWTAALSFSASLAYLQEVQGDRTGRWRRTSAQIQQYGT